LNRFSRIHLGGIVISGKNVSVRIKAEQARRLREIAEFVPGSSINALVQRAVQQWLEIEGPVYLEAFKTVRQSLEVRSMSR
jgi:hypothetical protein